ncbi:glycosyltransferase [Tropicimonas sp. IMCC6043]|nr:glycosyltransferase [Tropicimonas sp. IMCC6043]
MQKPGVEEESGATLRIPLGGNAALDVPLTHDSSSSLMADLEARLAGARGFACATVNLDHVVKLRGDAVFREAYARHSHVVADGNPIVWMSRLAGHPVGLVPGSELVGPVAAMAARRGWPIGLFGASEESLAAAASELESRHAGLVVSDRIAPPYGFDPSGREADAFIERMAQAPARLWLLALGAPKQEIFASRAWARLPDRGFLSVGAGLDFIGGRQVRAPRLVRALALEWAWRMVGNPARLGPRYARCAFALPGLTGAALAQRRERGKT